MPINVEMERPARRLTPFAESIRTFSQRLVTLQRPLRLLQALRWDNQVEHTFLARGGRELPRVNRDDYRSRPLGFDPDRRVLDFQDLERDIARVLGNRDGVGRILTRMCREYAGVVRMLAVRGTRTFGEFSARLFGTTRGEPIATAMQTLDGLAARFPGRTDEAPIKDAPGALDELANRLADCFSSDFLRFKLVDRIASDAAAGANYLKLRRDAGFTPVQIRLLEVHEGWVHLGTSYNAREQPICAFLRQGPPSATRTQEGLAVLTEFLGGAAHAARLRGLRQRVAAIQMAEQGADFLHVYRNLRETAADDRDAYRQTARVFRGSLPSGVGPFTKDLCYVFGLHSVVTALRRMRLDQIALMFCGKTAIEDRDTLTELAEAGLMKRPLFVPPPFRQPLPL